MELKITILIVMVSVTNIFASNTYSQTAKITLDAENKTLEQVMDEIEQQSEFYFIFNQKQVDVERVINIKAEDRLIGDILPELFFGTRINYAILDKKILLTIDPIKDEITVNNPSTQQNVVTGIVRDASTGQEMPGVNIQVKGATLGTISNIDGKYSLSVPDRNATLVFSFIGYITQEVPLNGRAVVEVVLTGEVTGLEEVVVIGYGTQKRASITGSVATVSSKKLTVAPVASASNTLAGRLPGLVYKQERGIPGGDEATLSIRGFGTPLIIVDGVESGFNNIDPNEIESVTVLKDASAAIYGARAGNGVILVTTKRGRAGKPVFTLNSTYSLQGPAFLPEKASSGQAAELIRERHLNAGNPESTARFTQEEVDLFFAGTNPDYPNTDWIGLVVRDWAPEQQHNLNVRGGSDNIKYYGFLGYLDQQSMFKKNGGEYQRYNFRSNIDAKITDRLSVQFDLSSIIEYRIYSMRGNKQGEQANSVWQEFWDTEPFWLSELPDKTKFPYGGDGGAVGIHAMSNYKVVGYKKYNDQNIKGTLSLNYDFKPIKGLSAKASANYNQNYNVFKMWDWLVDSYSYNYASDTYTQRTVGSNRGLTYSNSKNRMLTGLLSLNFDRTFLQDHHVTAAAIYEIMDYKNDYVSAFRDGQKTFLLDYAFAGSLTNQKVNDGASEMGRLSYIGRVNYEYKSKYILESTVRFDKSAKFSKEERLGIFPSISLGWRLSEEDFIKGNIPVLSNLKLRASYSQAGNDAVGNFQYLAGYRYGESYITATKPSIGLTATGLANPYLTWELMTIYNVGLDFDLSNRKLYGELDMFYRNREGIPGTRSVKLPTTFGASLPTENLNSINTRGFELTVGNEGNWKDFRWDINFNLSWSRSKWGFYDEPVYTDPDQEKLYKRTGQWTDVTFGYISEGLFTTQTEIDALDFKYNETQGNVSIKPGDIRYRDDNGDKLLNWRDQVQIAKGTMPLWMGGFNLNLSYKNFDFIGLFQGAFDFYQRIVLVRPSYSVLCYNERWTPENNHADGLIPRLGGAASNDYDSDFWYKKSDYLRLKTASLAYTLPNSLTTKVGVQNLRLYVAGTNVFTLSGLNKYEIDPESQSGWSNYFYPQMRTFTFGLNISF